MLDMEATGKNLDLAALQQIHRLKTGALLRACFLLGARPAAQYEALFPTLDALGQHWGLAYQILDDVLDSSATAETLGKTAGKDAAAGKLTYVRLLGLEASRQHLQHHWRAGEALLTALPRAEHLTALMNALFQRGF